MNRVLFGLAGLLVAACIVGGTADLSAQDKKVPAKKGEPKKGEPKKEDGDTPTIKTIMKKVSSKTGLLAELKASLGAKPDYDKAEAAAKAIVPLAEALGKNEPPKGDAKSWEKFTKAYADSAKGVLEAVEAKDAKKVSQAIKGMTDCKGCHMAHKGK